MPAAALAESGLASPVTLDTLGVVDQILVTKASGQKEPFSEEKVLRSVRRVGIPDQMAEQVLAHVKKFLRPDIPTREIYQHILEFLDKSQPIARTKFSLREALMQLGPSGYPFEDYIARVLTHYGYDTQVGLILQGKCISHEVDVVAQKDGQKYMLECKYHNQWGTRTDAKVALYVKSRFDDLASNQQFNQGWIVTNTKCTSDAIDYANCSGLKVISWGYPETENLQQLIESASLYPITCQVSLSSAQRQRLIKMGLVLCQDLKNLAPESASQIGLSSSQYQDLQQELVTLLP